MEKTAGKRTCTVVLAYEKIATFITDLMVFDRREQIFDSLLEFLKGLNPEIQLSFEDLSHEWLSYTTIGRPDLIYFENGSKNIKG